MALCWLRATHEAGDMLSVIHAFSSQAPALEKDGFQRGEKGKRAGEGICLLEISMREKTGINVNFSELSSSPPPPKFYFSPALAFRWRWNGEFRFSVCEGKWKHRAVSHFRFKLPWHKQGDSCNCFVHLHTWIQWRNSGHHADPGSAPQKKIFHLYYASTNKQATMKRAKIKALTVNVQISSCLNMCYENLWCYRKRRNVEEKVRPSLRMTAPQGSASTWNKETYFKKMFASRLYPLPGFKRLVSILYNLATDPRITTIRLHYSQKGSSTPTHSSFSHTKLSTGANLHSKTEQETVSWLKLPLIRFIIKTIPFIFPVRYSTQF